MEQELVLLDTSILIDYFRKRKKEKSALYQLSNQGTSFSISIFTKFEILIGSNNEQYPFWTDLFDQFDTINFEARENLEAIRIFKNLKARNKLIGFVDVLIAATAVANSLPLATLNTDHFKSVDSISLVSI